MRPLTMKEFSRMHVCDLVSEMSAEINAHDQSTVEVFDEATGSVSYWTVALHLVPLKQPNTRTPALVQ